ncbi:MAG: flagellar biosynthesis anti-sigma factor FlgM [Spirochaetaceae bacterium]|jgi:negative regulator of flagellin synthesis FlgM|nr:flagellar biosynthesis anti-sigma factor FlgM [Spirochaetaceae bacterium]
MAVNGIRPVDPIQNGFKPEQVKRAHRPEGDSIVISQEAREKNVVPPEFAKIVADAPDIRMDRVEELRAKINDPSYLNDAIYSATADHILDAWGI